MERCAADSGSVVQIVPQAKFFNLQRENYPYPSRPPGQPAYPSRGVRPPDPCILFLLVLFLWPLAVYPGGCVPPCHNMILYINPKISNGVARSRSSLPLLRPALSHLHNACFATRFFVIFYWPNNFSRTLRRRFKNALKHGVEHKKNAPECGVNFSSIQISGNRSKERQNFIGKSPKRIHLKSPPVTSLGTVVIYFQENSAKIFRTCFRLERPAPSNVLNRL